MSILRVLWDEGPSTVRDVWKRLNPAQGTGYTTILKLMQIMATKGLVKRDEASRSHVYKAAVSESGAQQQALRHLIERLFSGSTPRLVMQALAAKKASAEELAEIRKLLDRMEGGEK